MEEETGTLNEAGEPSQPADPQDTDDLVATVDQPIPEPESIPEPEDAEQPSPEEAKTTEDPSDENEADIPFHEHPRFQELIREKNALKEQVAQLAEKPPVEAPAKAPDYKDMGEMTAEEIQDAIDENPKNFMTNFAKQVRAEVMADVLGQVEQRDQANSEKQREKEIEAQYDKYSKEHPDFDKLWESGEIEKFMTQNPGHTPMSAHILVSQEARETEIYKKAEADVTAKLKAKQSSKVLSGGPSATGRPAGQIPAELKDTKKYGGLVSTLAQRSASRLKAA